MTSLDIDLPFTKRTLANGLDVIVHEDRHVPIVAVNIWYHVGSKNEKQGNGRHAGGPQGSQGEAGQQAAADGTRWQPWAVLARR